MDEGILASTSSMSDGNSHRRSSSQLLCPRENMPLADSIPSRGSSRVPTPSVWPRVESDAIQQWRGMTTVSSRSERHEPRIRDRENQPRSTDSLRSDAGLSSCGDSPSSNKKARDVTAHLKYLVRGFLRQTRSKTSAGDNTRKFTNKESFVPSPKITFLIDQPRNLVCQICQQAPLKLAITAEDPGPGMASIFPCGHISCINCINLWLASHTSCPFCRTTMIHPDCGHQVKPRLLAQDTIHSLPETLSNGGKISAKCFRCTERDRREISVERWTNLAERYKEARREAEIRGTDEAIEDMRRAQKAFERIPEDDYWVLSNMRYHQW